MEARAEKRDILSGIRSRIGALERDQRRALLASVFMFAVLVGEIAIYAYSAAAQGRGLGFLGELYGVDPRAGEEELRQFQLHLSRTILLTVFGQILLAAALLYRRTYRLLRDFFTTATHPLNLAVFRIVVFGFFLYAGYGSTASWYAELPEELRYPPYGIARLMDYGLDNLIYFSPQQIEVAYAIFLVCCITGVLGFFSRTSAFIVTVLAAFPLGATYFYGKVDHTMHLFWFTGILAFSPCGEVLSIDAIWRSWKTGLHDTVQRLKPARAYALPLCFIMLLIGITYFFPGFWKMWNSGLEWALGDNLKNTMHQKWHQLRPWMPFFRMDQYPLLYWGGGLFTMLFELSFVFLVLHPRTRIYAALGGITFHMMTYLFLDINFWSLYGSYVVFVDWHRVFRRIGNGLYKRPVYVQPLKGTNSRLVAVFKAFDVFDQIRTVPEGAYAEGVAASPRTGERRRRTIDASHLDRRDLRALTKRVPLLWPAYPIIRLFRLREQALSSATKRRGMERLQKEFRLSLVSVAFVGTLLIAGNVFCGVKEKIQAWPFSCYPTFSNIKDATKSVLAVDMQTEEGNTESRLLDELVRETTPNWDIGRFEGLMRKIIGWGPESWGSLDRSARLNALWEFLAERNPSLASVQRVTFYRYEILSDPERWEEPPVERHVMHEFSPEVSLSKEAAH